MCCPFLQTRRGPMNTNKRILTHCTLLDEEGNLHSNKTMIIHNGIIERITDEDIEGEDCTGLIISPGLVNCHTHAAMNIFKGIAEDVHIDAWFNEEI